MASKKERASKFLTVVGNGMTIAGTIASASNPSVGAGIAATGTAISTLPSVPSFFQCITTNVHKVRAALFYKRVTEKTESIIDFKAISDDDAEMLTDSCRKAMMTQSKAAISLIGYLVGDALKEKRNLSEGETQLVDILSTLNDYDLHNFIDIANVFDQKSRVYEDGKRLNESELLKELNGKNLIYTARKLENATVFYISSVEVENAEEGDSGTMLSGRFYYYSELGEDLLKLVHYED